MGRYISKAMKLKLLRNDGTVAYEFLNGVLDLGSGIEIDAAAKPDIADQLVYKFPTDLQGATTGLLEMAGMGSLTGLDYEGNSTDPIDIGRRGLFFESNIRTAGDSLVDAYTEDVWYLVLSGEIEYPADSGNTYRAGEKFSYISTQLLTGGDGTFCLTLPKDMGDEFLDEEFMIKHLRHGEEPKAYYRKDSPSGYVGRDGTATEEEALYGVGYIRGVVTPVQILLIPSSS